MRYGMTIPLERVPLLEQQRWVERIDALGYDDLWSSEGNQMDGFTPLALASQWTRRMRLGCAAFPVQTRGPALLAMSASTLCHAAPGRFVLGIAASSEPIVQWWNARTFEKPYAQVRDTIRFLRAAFRGEMITQEFEAFRVQYYKLRLLPPEPPPILVAGLREGMIRLGAREADGVILNMCTPEDVAKIVPMVKQYGEDREVALRISMCPTDDYERGMEIARRWAAGYVTVESYRAQQQWLGRGELIEETNRLWAQGDRKAARAALPEAAVQAGWMVGTPEQCRERIRAYEDAGLDTIILSYLEDVCEPDRVIEDLAPAAVRAGRRIGAPGES